MSQLDLKAAILRLHNEHAISCPADAENKLVQSLEELEAKNDLTKNSIHQVAARMPAQFFQRNGLDSASQYSRLLWDAISVASTKTAVPTSTHFHGPVSQKGIFQTGSASTAQWIETNQTLNFYQQISRPLTEARAAAELELDANKKAPAFALIEAAQTEAAKENPDQSKIKNLLTPMLKWTGKRFTNAIDAALGVVIANTVNPSS
jgi:hypothetical protein